MTALSSRPNPMNGKQLTRNTTSHNNIIIIIYYITISVSHSKYQILRYIYNTYIVQNEDLYQRCEMEGWHGKMQWCSMSTVWCQKQTL